MLLFLAVGRCQNEEGQIPVRVVGNNETSTTQEDREASKDEVPLFSNITYITIGDRNQPKVKTGTATENNEDQNEDLTFSESTEDPEDIDTEEPIRSTPTTGNVQETKTATEKALKEFSKSVSKNPDIQIVEKDIYVGNETGFNASHNLEIQAQNVHPITIGLEKNDTDGPFTLNVAVPKDIRNANIVIQIPLNVNVKASDRTVDNKSGIKVKIDETPKYKEDFSVDSVNSGKDDDYESREPSSKVLTGSVLHGKQKLTDAQLAKIIKEKIKKSRAADKLDKLRLQEAKGLNEPKKRPETLFFKIQ
ncbi:uncharacterized protein LOC126379558 isoform X2 [Pectinophora gossypiella]|uniref:uncharacterized protein LOC126379558 isoform X2 n=1 Tax=Pectinophora gossypiella TaxID=13191 RepID=UPI00214DF69D|nr:uncharacterized protein LOC126379558 isoform X2 [Pectinophora gossypiella]